MPMKAKMVTRISNSTSLKKVGKKPGPNPAGKIVRRPGKEKSAQGIRPPKDEGEEDRAKRLRLVELPWQQDENKAHEGRAFTGKATVTDDGLTAMDRFHSSENQKEWNKRRKPIAPPPGGWPQPPAHWPKDVVRVDLGRAVPWLPKGWGQGVKLTCVTKLLAFVSPEGKVYYHKHVIEEVIGKKPTGDGARDWEEKWVDFSLRWEKNLVLENIKMVTAWVVKQLQEGRNWMGEKENFIQDENKLFENLTKAERQRLPDVKELHVAVISARRASDARSLKIICGVQAQIRAGGVEPVWYVDRPSLQAYRRLGLNAKVGGKLIEARNMALNDANKLCKACVQISDDIHRWTYYAGDLNAKAFADTVTNRLQGGNEAAKQSDELHVSPPAAARFLLAKLRAADGPKLAGVFPVGNAGMALTREAVSPDKFILGDFFVADNSPVRFDRHMTLKEDYDFTCAHLQAHGSVLRCNRMLIQAVHETNYGGAVSDRDANGDKERENIKILQEKWPGVFHLNGRRGDTQVIMCWRRLQR